TSGVLSVVSSSFSVTAAAPNLAQSSMVFASALIVGGSSTATFTFRDSFGNVVSGANVSLAATIAGMQFAPASGQSNASGVFTSSVSSAGPGTGTITATVASTALGFSVSVLPSAGDYNVSGAM